MPDRRIPTYPTIDDPARFDRIVQRGRSIRRRRQRGVGAGAGGSVAAVALAVVVLTGGTTPDSNIVADGDRDPAAETTTTTAAPPPTLTVDVGVDGGALLVDVHDPAQPVSDASRQCVLVSVTGPDNVTAEGYGCDDVDAVGGAVPVELAATDGVMIGCAATVTPPDPEAPQTYPTADVSTSFSLAVPADLPAGEYRVDVSVTSGIGDGCAGTGDEAEPDAPAGGSTTEHAASASATLDLG
jgi:hypothetical protein